MVFGAEGERFEGFKIMVEFAFKIFDQLGYGLGGGGKGREIFGVVGAEEAVPEFYYFLADIDNAFGDDIRVVVDSI